MEAYINSVSVISPQKTFVTSSFLDEVVQYNSNSLRCIEPAYKEYLDPVMARRMGRVIKMSIAAASVCLKDAGLKMPDAIITGTALGCVESTEKFIVSMIQDEERFLTPISFMQSTHNTVGAQIALQLKCNNYNFTYVHRGFAFESALLDAMMQISDGSAKNILVGAHEEMTEKNFRIYDRVNNWKKENVPMMELLHSKTHGVLAGEGVAFFVLGNERKEQSYAKILAVKTIYKPESQAEIENKITELLNEKQLTIDDIDVVIYGIAGDPVQDEVYYKLMNSCFSKSTSAYFKHLSGEYQTSGSFAIWMAAMILKNQTIPKEILIGLNKHKAIKNVLVYNTFQRVNHGVFLLATV